MAIFQHTIIILQRRVKAAMRSLVIVLVLLQTYYCLASGEKSENRSAPGEIKGKSTVSVSSFYVTSRVITSATTCVTVHQSRSSVLTDARIKDCKIEQ